jgi:hypothetical protein
MDPLPNKLAVPRNFVGFCKSCHYNLHGLSDARCPECGRMFDPASPLTFDRTPSGSPNAGSQIVATSSGDTFRAFFPPHVADRLARLERQVRQVTGENDRLVEIVQTVVKMLRDRGAFTPEELIQLGQLTATIGVDEIESETSLASEPDVDEAALRAIEAEDAVPPERSADADQ